MGWDFWRSRESSENRDGRTTKARPSKSSADREDPTAELRVRARRRLIGAAALLLAVVVIVPAVLDPTPAPLPNTIPIEIPEESTVFTPRLSLPPLPEPASDRSVLGAEAEPTLPTSNGDEPPEASDDASDSSDTEADTDQGALDATTDDQAEAEDAKQAQALLDGTAASSAVTTAPKKYALQVAATSSLASARRLAKRLERSGFKSYVTEFESGSRLRFRVRIGPYADRNEAEQVRARLRAKGHKANLVSL